MQTTSGIKFTETVTMETILCANCGCMFAISAEMILRFRRSRETFYCPTGHSNWYSNGTTEKQKLEETEAKVNKLANLLAQAETAKIQLENQLNKANKKLARVEKGTCPCCDKTYKHLANHRATKHPEELNKLKTK